MLLNLFNRKSVPLKLTSRVIGNKVIQCYSYLRPTSTKSFQQCNKNGGLWDPNKTCNFNLPPRETASVTMDATERDEMQRGVKRLDYGQGWSKIQNGVAPVGKKYSQNKSF